MSGFDGRIPSSTAGAITLLATLEDLMARAWFGIVLVAALVAPATSVSAQSLGTYSWQLAPYCNVVTVDVTQLGSTYTLDGYDTQSGGANSRAPLTGMAVINPNGTIEIGLTIVTSPGGTPVHVDTTIDLATLGGPWRTPKTTPSASASPSTTGRSSQPYGE
jgi:hypothetical protein